jgi:hypothetical protein
VAERPDYEFVPGHGFVGGQAATDPYGKPSLVGKIRNFARDAATGVFGGQSAEYPNASGFAPSVRRAYSATQPGSMADFVSAYRRHPGKEPQ